MTQAQTSEKPLLLRIFTALFYIPADLYGIALTPLLLLWLILGESFWLTTLIANLMPGVFFPLVYGLIIGIILRRRFTLTLQLLPLLMFIILYAAVFIPRSVDTLDGQPLRVMTYNMLFLNENVEEMASLITEQNPDVVAIQEMPPEFYDRLEAQLNTEYPYWLFEGNQNNSYGNIIASRYPIVDNQSQFETSGSMLYLAADIDVNDSLIRVYNMHIAPPRFANGFNTNERTEGITQFLIDLRNEKPQMPLIIMGDFNMSDKTGDYRRMNNGFTDVYRATSTGFGTTFEYFGALGFGWIPTYVRLDYIFLRDGVTSQPLIPVASAVLRTGNSDHLPIMADLVIAP